MSEKDQIKEFSSGVSSSAREKSSEAENTLINHVLPVQGEATLSLLDGASSQAPIIAPELERQKMVAADTTLPLNERLEAYEDIGSGTGLDRRGFKCLKLKGRINLDSDIERVLKVRESVGKGIELRFDANQGFSAEDSLRFVEQTRKARLELIEQPTPKGEAGGYGGLHG